MSTETITVGHSMGLRPRRPSIGEYEARLRNEASPSGRLRRVARWLLRRPRQEGQVTPFVDESLAKARHIRRQHDLVFYIAGALTGMSEETKQRYTDLHNVIAAHSTSETRMYGYAPHLHGTDPVKHPDVTPREVRIVDYLWAVVVPDAHFNFMHPVAHGNAIEAGWAEEHAIPSVHIVPEDMTTSRLVRGMENIAATVTYQDFTKDGLPQINSLLDGLRSSGARV